MLVEVVTDFDGGVVEPGDRGMVTSKGKRVVFHTRVPTVGPMALYDWRPDPIWKEVEGTAASLEAYTEKRRGQFYDAIDALKIVEVLDTRYGEQKAMLDDRLLAVVRAVPGLLVGQIAHYFYVPPLKKPERIWISHADEKTRARVSLQTKASLGRLADRGKIELTGRGWQRARPTRTRA